ncbi:DUF817 family protein [Streptomyces sp. NPDC004457]
MPRDSRRGHDGPADCRPHPIRDPGLAAAVHLGFFTHHWLPDLRRPLAVAMTAATAGTRVGFGVGAHRYRMPLAVSSVLIGFFPWVAESAATCAGPGATRSSSAAGSRCRRPGSVPGPR